LSQNGTLKLENLTFALDDNFKAGLYELIVRDVTHGIDPSDILPEQRIDMKFVDSEAEAELAAQLAA
jgi:hypothetical protein